MAGEKIFPCRSGSDEKALYHCDPAPQCDRKAAYGTCLRRDLAGHPDPLQEDAGL